MKKSNKPEITSEQLLEDFNKIISFIEKLDNQDLSKMDLEKLSVNSEKIKTHLTVYLFYLMIMVLTHKHLLKTSQKKNS